MTSSDKLKAGYTYINEGEDYYCSGIDVGEHSNRIECYGFPESEAVALRDRVLAALNTGEAETSAGVEELALKTSQAVMAYVNPHLKNMIAFNTLREAVEDVLRPALTSTRPNTGEDVDIGAGVKALEACREADGYSDEHIVRCIIRAALQQEPKQ